MRPLDRMIADANRQMAVTHDEHIRPRVERVFGKRAGVYERTEIPAWLDCDAKPLHLQMRDAAADLAARVDAGLFDALDRDMRCDLRALSLAISAWSEQAEGLALIGASAISSNRQHGAWLRRLRTALRLRSVP